jgi:hypothetical protein
MLSMGSPGTGLRRPLLLPVPPTRQGLAPPMHGDGTRCHSPSGIYDQCFAVILMPLRLREHPYPAVSCRLTAHPGIVVDLYPLLQVVSSIFRTNVLLWMAVVTCLAGRMVTAGWRLTCL